MAKIKVDYPLKKSKSLDKALEPGNKTGFVTVMSPTDFLKHAKRLKETKEDKLLISSFKEGMKDGKKFKALKLLDHNLADGRHRATAAEELGIKKIPVIDYRESDLAKEPDGIHAVSKKSNRVGKATGGAMNLPLGSDDPNDAFRRLITWSFATAPLFHRAEGGPIDGEEMPEQIEQPEDPQEKEKAIVDLALNILEKYADSKGLDESQRSIIDAAFKVISELPQSEETGTPVIPS